MRKPAKANVRLELRRFWRRVLAVGLYALYSGLLTLWALSPQPFSSSPGLPTQWLTVAGFALMALAALVLYVATGGVSDIYDRDLYAGAKPSPIDERQEKVRNRAYLSSYLILGPSLLVLIFSAREISFIWLVALGLFLYATLPTVVLAWLEPDPLDEPLYERLPSGRR